MLTSGVDGQAATTRRDDRPAFRPYRAQVVDVVALSPHFVRVTFTGGDLCWFGRDGLDQRIKLFLPVPGCDPADFGADDEQVHLDGSWYTRWLALPDDRRPPMRTFTVRAVRAACSEIDVDFAVHDDPTHPPGPAGAWVRDARPGSELVIVGPDARSLHSASGIDWQPGAATEHLLVGDETAVPAICAILESLGERAATTTALIEFGDAADAVPLETRAQVRWLIRDPRARGRVLRAAVVEWLDTHAGTVARAGAPAPQPLEEVDVDTALLWETSDGTDPGLYAWLAGEAGVIKDLRRLLVREAGIDRSRVAFMGYWREGRAEQS